MWDLAAIGPYWLHSCQREPGWWAKGSGLRPCRTRYGLRPFPLGLGEPGLGVGGEVHNPWSMLHGSWS